MVLTPLAPSEEAMQRLIEAAGEQFDPKMVEVFKTYYQS
jgi:HD-GYP domain-containing protein (c-di-GMP phosphodiesterase class II)